MFPFFILTWSKSLAYISYILIFFLSITPLKYFLILVQPDSQNQNKSLIACSNTVFFVFDLSTKFWMFFGSAIKSHVNLILKCMQLFIQEFVNCSPLYLSYLINCPNTINIFFSVDHKALKIQRKRGVNAHPFEWGRI